MCKLVGRVERWRRLLLVRHDGRTQEQYGTVDVGRKLVEGGVVLGWRRAEVRQRRITNTRTRGGGSKTGTTRDVSIRTEETSGQIASLNSRSQIGEQCTWTAAESLILSPRSRYSGRGRHGAVCIDASQGGSSRGGSACYYMGPCLAATWRCKNGPGSARRQGRAGWCCCASQGPWKVHGVPDSRELTRAEFESYRAGRLLRRNDMLLCSLCVIGHSFTFPGLAGAWAAGSSGLGHRNNCICLRSR